jgi:hypothetical protein
MQSFSTIDPSALSTITSGASLDILRADRNQALRHLPDFGSSFRDLALTDRHWG